MRICGNMNRFFMKPLLAAAALLTASTVEAGFFWVGGIQYVTLDETTCEVGDNEFFSGCAKIPEQVTYNGNTYTVTQIGKRAFYEAKNLTEVHIPKTVTVIYDDAFYGSNAGWVEFEDGEDPVEIKSSSHKRLFDKVPVVNAYVGRDFIIPSGYNPPFSFNDAILTAEVGDLVTSLPSEAFYKCPNLTQLTIGSGLKSIGDDAFYMAGVQNLYIDNLEQWCNIDFGTVYSNPLAFNQGWLHVGGADATYDIVIPDGVTKISSYAFAGAKLNTVTVPSGVTEIGNEVFSIAGAISRPFICRRACRA